MSSIDTQAAAPVLLLPGPASVLLLPSPASSRSVGQRASRAIAVFVGQLALTGFTLALSAAAVPVVTVYSFIWLAQH